MSKRYSLSLQITGHGNPDNNLESHSTFFTGFYRLHVMFGICVTNYMSVTTVTAHQTTILDLSQANVIEVTCMLIIIFGKFY
jgi:hypothetical protein